MKWLLFIILGWSFAEATWGWTYHYSNNTMTWSKARKWCQEHFTDMVAIQNQTENDYIVSILPNRTNSPYYWIGLTKEHINETWKWVGNNSTWVGEHSWAENEPNNNHITEFCVEIYINSGQNRGKWNDEKCAKNKSPVCYKAQCNDSSCVKGSCWETLNSTACLCTDGYEGDKCQTAVQCPPLPQPSNGNYSCSKEGQIFNSTCHFKCHLGFFMIGSSAVTCAANGHWTGPRPVCTSYKQALLAVAGCGALCSFFCICFCCIRHRKKKKRAQDRLVLHREPEDATSPPSDVNGGTSGNSLAP
ncbi:L-selectin-like isoform X2 [Xiphophorus hellerii]|uniref:L-selectin-like isoform X2 n=1 Tax=Xiphophorus hellerii TaxID=8084 RepID=UPI0013B3A2C0|nr:L-selectin-like isoform X2 [Xiphophorus hellerii]